MAINLFRDLGVDDDSVEVRRAREEASLFARVVARLSGARKQQVLTQKQVADRMGTTQSAVSELEAGLKDVRLTTLIRYAQAVDCDVDLKLSRRDSGAEPLWAEVVEVKAVNAAKAQTVKVRMQADVLAALNESEVLFTAANSRRYDFAKAA